MLDILQCLTGLLLFFAGLIFLGLLIEHCRMLILQRIDRRILQEEIAEFLKRERMRKK
jgi:hypothetical protein